MGTPAAKHLPQTCTNGQFGTEHPPELNLKQMFAASGVFRPQPSILNPGGLRYESLLPPFALFLPLPFAPFPEPLLPLLGWPWLDAAPSA